MVIHARDKTHILQMECAPSKGTMNLSHKAAASTSRVMSPKRSALHDLLQAAAD